MKKVYLDSSVLLSAFKGEGKLAWRAIEIIDNPEYQLVLSEATILELFPKPIYQNEEEEIDFYEEIFSKAEIIRWNVEFLRNACTLGIRYGLSAMDAIHIAIAIFAGVDEFYYSGKRE